MENLDQETMEQKRTRWAKGAAERLAKNPLETITLCNECQSTEFVSDPRYGASGCVECRTIEGSTTKLTEFRNACWTDDAGNIYDDEYMIIGLLGGHL